MTYADRPLGGEGRVLTGAAQPVPGAVRDDDGPALPAPGWWRNQHGIKIRVYNYCGHEGSDAPGLTVIAESCMMAVALPHGVVMPPA